MHINSDRIKKVNLIMASIIVAYHFGSLATPVNILDEHINSGLSTIMNELAILAMGWFFTVSGFFLFLNYDYDSIKPKLSRRIKNLLVPYLLWQIITVPVNIVENNELISMEQFISTVLLMRRWPPDGALWYMYSIFILSLLSPLILVFLDISISKFNNTVVKGSVLLIMAFALRKGFFFDFGSIQDSYLLNTIIYLPAYVLGILCGYTHNDKREKHRMMYFCILFTFVVLVQLVIERNIVSQLSLFLQIVPVFIIEFLPSKKSGKPLRQIVGAAPFMMYAIHHYCMPFKKYIVSALEKLIPYAAFINFTGRIFFVIIVAICSILVIIVMDHLMPGTLSLLTGGRCRLHKKEKSKAGTSL